MRILRLRDVINQTGLGRSSIYKFSKLGEFPQSVRLGGSVGWKSTQLNLWIIQRIRERDSAPLEANHITPWAINITEQNLSDSDLRVLRIEQVMERTGLARSTVYKYVKEWNFPRQILLTGTCKGWLAAEVTYWLKTVTQDDICLSRNEVGGSLKAA